MNFCMRCGTKLQKGDAFCPQCGTKVMELPVQPAAAEQPPQKTEQASPQPREAEQPSQQPAQTPAQEPQPQQTAQSEPQAPEQAYQPPKPPQQAQPAAGFEDEFEMVQPPQQGWNGYGGNYAPPRQAQQSPYARPTANYGQNRPAQGSYFNQGQPGYGQRPAYGNGYPQQRPGTRTVKGYGPDGRPIPVKNRGWLKLLSLIFALGLLAAAVGLAGNIYFDRSWKEITKDSKQSETNYALDAQFEDLAKRLIKAEIRQDPAEFRKIMLEGNHLDGYYGDDRKYGNADNDAIIKEWMKAYNEFCDKSFGYRWTIMKVGAYGDTLLLIGGITAGAALLLWLILGGTRAGLSRTTVMPVLVMVIIWGAGLMLAALVIAPVDIAALRGKPDMPTLEL